MKNIGPDEFLIQACAIYIVIIGARISICIIDVAIITIFKLTFARERERGNCRNKGEEHRI